MAGATIVKEELLLDVKVKFTGEIAGIEPDDTNVEITLKGSTETLSIVDTSSVQFGLKKTSYSKVNNVDSINF